MGAGFTASKRIDVDRENGKHLSKVYMQAEKDKICWIEVSLIGIIFSRIEHIQKPLPNGEDFLY